MEMQDVPAIAKAAKAAGAVTVMDNTWATPLFFKPFDHGVDVSITAGTKYVVGHSDAMLGSVTATPAAWPAIHKANYLLGHCVGPDDAYLAQRGLRTLAVRLARHQESALKVAQWLEQQPEIEHVLYPALPSHPGHALWKRDFTGSSGLFSVVFRAPRTRQELHASMDRLKVFRMGYSWGGVSSLVVTPELSEAPNAQIYEDRLVRFYVGLEDPEDLIRDLQQAFHG
jgi:cystathionine beta-lyase